VAHTPTIHVRSCDLPGEEPKRLGEPFAEVRLTHRPGEARKALRLLARVAIVALVEARKRDGAHDATPRDWRGTSIEIGATVIYGAGVGRSIAMVEAVVDGFTDTGRVWLAVRHRAYGGGWHSARPRVHVGADRLTVVSGLPPTELPTEGEKSAAERERLRAQYAGHLEALLATGCDVCFEPIPFGTRCWLRHKAKDAETGLPVVAVVCDACHEERS
jgi:hypothetical protein